MRACLAANANQGDAPSGTQSVQVG